MKLDFANWLLNENEHYIQEFRTSLFSLLDAFEMGNWKGFIENKLDELLKNPNFMRVFNSDTFIKRLSYAVEYVRFVYSTDKSGFVSSEELYHLPIKFNIIRELLKDFGFSSFLDHVYKKMYDWALEKVDRIRTALHDIADILDMPPLPQEIEEKFNKLIKDPVMWRVSQVDVDKIEKYVDKMVNPNYVRPLLGLIAKEIPLIFYSGEYEILDFLLKAEEEADKF